MQRRGLGLVKEGEWKCFEDGKAVITKLEAINSKGRKLKSKGINFRSLRGI